ncbi:unnamed protein product [Protopolystoma xenopodis]|uniref:Rab-GAP TBC domain-containing protein n=1 Tax=Protopolystoma xenopodis TaxID=117903 RepID=A0A448WA38_9PLAT|nr:unnamed protein product [Protopolystoma xenopodis]
MFERILFIWSNRHPASGYVQGINDLLSPFFVVFLAEYIRVDHILPRIDLTTSGELTLLPEPTPDQLEEVEADVFWCVSRLLDSIQDNYTFPLPGIQHNLGMLASLVERVDSELHAHLRHHQVEYLQFAFRWMNNLLTREVPLRCSIRLWDTYMSEDFGFSRFHVFVCAAFLLQFAEDLKCQGDFQGLLLMLQRLPTYHWTDDNMNLVLAKAFELKTLFRDAPNHLEYKRLRELD